MWSTAVDVAEGEAKKETFALRLKDAEQVSVKVHLAWVGWLHRVIAAPTLAAVESTPAASSFCEPKANCLLPLHPVCRPPSLRSSTTRRARSTRQPSPAQLPLAPPSPQPLLLLQRLRPRPTRTPAVPSPSATTWTSSTGLARRVWTPPFATAPSPRSSRVRHEVPPNGRSTSSRE